MAFSQEQVWEMPIKHTARGLVLFTYSTERRFWSHSVGQGVAGDVTQENGRGRLFNDADKQF